jgi:7-cyano-7-deazaguanine reductase
MLHDAPLGKKTKYIQTYTPDLLFPIPRSLARDKIGLQGNLLPFDGVDIWNGFELSWLNAKGKPVIALAEFIFPCSSAFIVESKSFKLYLNSFNQSVFATPESVQKTLIADLEKSVQAPVKVKLILFPMKMNIHSEFEGTCLDALDIETQIYQVTPELLTTSIPYVEETVYSHLLKSDCPATGQPDWGSVLIRYSGRQIEHAQLLKYIISYRNHAGFAEHCVEQIFHDILHYCQPNKLTVYARYTKRGGLDINPFRSNFEAPYDNIRWVRQ